MGPPVKGPVLAPLAVYSSTTVYKYTLKGILFLDLGVTLCLNLRVGDLDCSATLARFLIKVFVSLEIDNKRPQNKPKKYFYCMLSQIRQFRPQWDYHKYIFVGKTQSRSNGMNLEMEADANLPKRRHGI